MADGVLDTKTRVHRVGLQLSQSTLWCVPFEVGSMIVFFVTDGPPRWMSYSARTAFYMTGIMQQCYLLHTYGMLQSCGRHMGLCFGLRVQFIGSRNVLLSLVRYSTVAHNHFFG